MLHSSVGWKVSSGSVRKTDGSLFGELQTRLTLAMFNRAGCDSVSRPNFLTSPKKREREKYQFCSLDFFFFVCVTQ